MRLLIRWLITIAAVAAAAWIVPGIEVEPEAKALLIFAMFAVILALVNAVIRPILALLSCGCIIATLGLFMLVINAVSLLLASWIAQQFGVGFVVHGFWPAFWGSIIISIVSFALSLLLPDPDKKS